MKIRRLIGGSLESNGYIIYHREKDICYIIDPGYDPERYIKVLEQMEMQVLGILLTHHHYDHVGAVEGIVKRFGCPVYLHRDDWGQYGRPVDYMLEDGQSIMLGHEEIKVIHTPGHTKGSVCYYSEKSKAAFTGYYIQCRSGKDGSFRRFSGSNEIIYTQCNLQVGRRYYHLSRTRRSGYHGICEETHQEYLDIMADSVSKPLG